MAEQDQARSEQATPYKLEQARMTGSVARGQDLVTFAIVMAGTAYLAANGSTLGERLARLMQRAIAQAGSLGSEPAGLGHWAIGVVAEGLHAVLPLMLTLLAAAVAAILVQIGFLFAPGSLKPDMQRINPMRVIERLFSVQTVIELIRSVLKLVLYTLCAVLVIQQVFAQMPAGQFEALRFISLMHGQALRLLFLLAAAMALFAMVDWVLVRWQFGKKMQMSRREVREEARHREGDPRMKQQRKRFQMELLKKTRSMRAMRSADVLVTNPTHFAVGLKYDERSMLAPITVAKGAGEFALRLKRLALVYGVPVVEQRSLARKLYFKVPLNDPLPAALFADTAKIYLDIRRRRQRAPVGA